MTPPPPAKTRDARIEQIALLDPLDRILLQILALVAEPIPERTLFDLCKLAGLPLTAEGNSPAASLTPNLGRLKKLKLITADHRVPAELTEILARQFFADTTTMVTPPVTGKAPKKSDKPARPPGPVLLTTAMVNAIRALLPVPSTTYYSSRQMDSICGLYRRELRFALHQRNWHRLDSSLDFLADNCPTPIDPLIPLLNTPFDDAWFATLPTTWQAWLLRRIFTHTTLHLEPDQEALTYGLKLAQGKTVSAEDRSPFVFDLIVRLLLGGQISEARALLETIRRHEPKPYAYGLDGLLALLRGQSEEALEFFAADLKELRRLYAKRNLFFGTLVAPFAILALLRKGDAVSLKKAGLALEQARRCCEYSRYALTPIFAALEAILDNQNGLLPEVALQPLAPWTRNWQHLADGLAPLFVAMAVLTISGRLTAKVINILSQGLARSREAGLTWLAVEYTELLCRADKETPGRRDFIRTFCEATGVVPLCAGIEIEEPWKKTLRALRLTAETAQPRGMAAAGGSQGRVVYLLRFSKKDELVEISPLEQKISAKGEWTKGRPIALQRFASGEKLDGLDEADQPLRTAVRRSNYYYGHSAYEFNLKLALPALVGHPRLFLAESPATPVEVLKGEPEILVLGKGEDLLVSFLPEFTDEERQLLVRETPTRYRLFQLSEAQQRLAQLLGPKGLALPAEARDEVAGVLASVSALVTVHSTIPGTAHSIETIQADPCPCVHLLPHGEGFRLEMLVKPFREGGPYLKPGLGAKNLMAEVGGRKCQTERDIKAEQDRAAALERSLPALASLAEVDGQWFAETPEVALQVLMELQEAQQRGETRVEWPEGEKLKVGKVTSFADLRLKLRSSGTWFEIDGDLRIDEERLLDMKQLLDLLQATPHRFLPLGEGQFVALSRELRKRLDELAAYVDKRGKKMGIHPLAALALEDLTGQAGQLDADPHWYARLEQVREGMAATPALPTTLKAQLRDYQREGYQWLVRLSHLGFGACLADDMGLGKTVQTLAAILHNAPQGPTLVVAPTSVCANWVVEAARFAPTLNLIPFGGVNREALVADLGPFDVMVSSYGLLHQESELLTTVDWQTVVLDEAQAIKNAATKRSQAAMGLKARFKVVTTGTPIENHLGEFWTLFNFINPGLLGSRERFNTRFAGPIERSNDREARRRLKKLVQPFILRRLKSQVLEELPPRTEVMLQVEMSPEETAFYEALRQKALERIEAEQGAAGQKPMQILAEITRLRQACCHPRLILPESALVGSKLTLFGEVVAELLENGHKALVFSQFVGHLALIREYLDQRHIPYRYLDGSTPPKERQREVTAFQAGEGDLFLISLKAGGLGLNLTAADYVIHMDPWWNPAVEDQASDRAHRIGQERPVTVYRLVAKNTIEEKIVRMHAEKRDLADSLLDETDASARISADELLRLIREP